MGVAVVPLLSGEKEGGEKSELPKVLESRNHWLKGRDTKQIPFELGFCIQSQYDSTEMSVLQICSLSNQRVIYTCLHNVQACYNTYIVTVAFSFSIKYLCPTNKSKKKFKTNRSEPSLTLLATLLLLHQHCRDRQFTLENKTKGINYSMVWTITCVSRVWVCFQYRIFLA